MKLFYYILLLLFSSFLLSEEAEIIVLSGAFTIDTIDPEIELLSPSHGDSFQQGDQILVTWDAYDQSPASHPMTLNVSAELDNPYFELASNFPNIGSLELGVPSHINTLFASIRLDIVDYFGNMTSAYSDGYFILGNPNEQIYDVVNESITIQAASEDFEVDTKLPEVSWIFPNESTSFIPGQGQVVRWDAVDDSFIDNPIDLLLIDGGVDSYILSEDNSNNGQAFINLPDITTSLGHFKIIATDKFGNINYDLSDEYISIGPNSNSELEQESVIIEASSPPFTMDSKIPTFSLINESDYFYPNGGEILTDYNNVQLDWNCNDDSFDNGMVEISLAYLLGGWYTVIDTFSHSSVYAVPSDFSINGLVDNTIWGRLIFTAIDDFGNRQSQYNDDYFVLGSSDGDIDIGLADEDELEMMLSWTWETEQHTIVILNRAINFLEEGDKIVIVDESGVNNSSCDQENGYIELSEGIIGSNLTGTLKIPPIKSHFGIDHCSAGGGKLPGYVEQDSIRFMIVSDDESYFLRPNNYQGSLVFDNGATVIKEFSMDQYQLNSDNNNDVYTINERDDDNFNVYSKVTNHQSNFRNCDNDGVCDSSELLADYTNQESCELNNGIWNISYCYYDFNNDGAYSPDEFDENIGDCYSDCCTSQGSGENEDWCFVDQVSEDVYTHSLIQQNYVANQQSSATINYRVWVLDNEGEELFKTVETDGVDINIDASSIGDYDKSFSSGWNWFSLNVKDGNGDMTLNNLFNNSILSNNDYIKSQTQASTYYTAGNVWYPELNLDVKSLYMLNIESDASISFSGIYADETDSIFIEAGWNWIGYTPQNSNDINSALSSMNSTNADYIKSQTTSSIYYSAGNTWYPEISMNPTEGYMLNSDASDTLIYTADRENDITLGNSSSDYIWSVPFRDFQYNASSTLKIDIDNIAISEDDQIAIFDNGQCVGTAKADICPLNNEILFNLMYYSNQVEASDLNLRYYNAITDSYYDIKERIDFQADTYIGNAFEPFIIHDGTLPEEYALLDPYPNPFNPITKIDFTLPNNVDNISINIYDIRGRLVDVLLYGNMSSGYHSLYWNADIYSSGIYFVHMIADKNTFIKKITLLK